MGRSQPAIRPSSQLAWFVTAPLAALAVVLTIAAQIDREIPPLQWVLAAVYLALFVIAESVSLNFYIRRQGMVQSLAEVPLLLALFYLSPLTLVVVRALATLLVATRRRQPPVKLWFNVASKAAGTAFAVVIVRALSPLSDGSPPGLWLVLVAGVTGGVLVTLGALIAVITLVQGRISNTTLLRTAVPGLVINGMTTVLGLAVLLIVQQNPWGILVVAALTAVLVVAYRSHARFIAQHQTLTELYELARSLRGSIPDGALPDLVLTRVRAMMNAECATLWLPAQGRHLEVLLSARADDRGLIDVVTTPAELRSRAIERDQTVAVSRRLGDDELRASLVNSKIRDVIVVPLHSGSAVIGTLEVAGRMNEMDQFGIGDVHLMEAVAVQVAVAVENSRLVERLRYDAYHDGLSNLPNRRRITEALAASVSVRAPGEVVAVLLFDVDGLREVNESLGHAAGDRLLAEVARRLRRLASPAALVGRLGGDEFVVTLRAESADAAVQLAEDLRDRVRGPLDLGTLTLEVDTSVGVVVHPEHGDQAEQLLQRADLATSAAKAAPSGVQLFHPGLESRAVRRLGLAGDLRRALEREEIEVYFQPKVALGDRRLVGVECLARWEHPAHGAVAPEDFVAVAEHTGQLGALTEAVLRQGLQRCRDWPDQGQPLSVAVNLSARSLVDPTFPNQVEQLLEYYGVAPDRVTFEIAQPGVVAETQRPLPIMRRLRDIGVRLSVDDFGTGASSLAYLRRLPVQEVKIDRGFVQGMATDPGDLAIVRAVVNLAGQFGLAVVAEGVESELTLELLKDMGCEIGQGFLFSRPLPYERLEAWFWAQSEADSAPAGEVVRLRAVQ